MVDKRIESLKNRVYEYKKNIENVWNRKDISSLNITKQNYENLKKNKPNFEEILSQSSDYAFNKAVNEIIECENKLNIFLNQKNL